MDRTDHTERPEFSGQSSQIRRRPGIREGTKRPRSARAKSSGGINYRLMLCIAVLVFFVLALLFFILFTVRGGTINDLNGQITTLTQEKDSLSAQVTSLTQENQTMLTSLAGSLDTPTVAETTDLATLIPQLTEGVYVVYNNGSQLQYLSVPSGYLQDRLAAYRDDSASFVAAADATTPACTYYVLFPDRVIGLAQGNTGFVSMDRAATGTLSTTPSGLYDLVASMFA